MIDHLGINCADWEKSKTFYDEVLGVLGYTRQLDYHVAIGYGHDGKPDFWIADMNAGDAAGPNRETHVAFHAKDPDAVHAFHDAAVRLGAESLHEPRYWPEYHPGYYGSFVRDPDGNNVEAVFHGGAPAPTEGIGGAPAPTEGDGGAPAPTESIGGAPAQ